jgi:hypothetical protein
MRSKRRATANDNRAKQQYQTKSVTDNAIRWVHCWGWSDLAHLRQYEVGAGVGGWVSGWWWQHQNQAPVSSRVTHGQQPA